MEGRMDIAMAMAMAMCSMEFVDSVAHCLPSALVSVPNYLYEGCNTSSFGKPYKLWLLEKQFSSLKSASNIKMLLFC